MFATIRRHQKWLWFVVIAFVIISFVAYLDPTVSTRRGGPRARGKANYGYIYGHSIGREELMEAYQEARLQFFMYTRSWPEENQNAPQMFNPDRAVPERLFLIEKLDQMNIEVGDQAVADWIARSFRENGVFNLDAYKQFVQRDLQRGGVTEEDLRRYVRHEIGLRQVVALGGLTGQLVVPREAETLFRRENEQVTAEIALFSATNFLANVMVQPEALSAFYTNQAARYRTPERVEVSYVQFPATNYLAEADQTMAQRTNLSAEIEAVYHERGAAAYRDANGALLSADAARQKIREQLREEFAVIAARKKAAEFAQALYDQYEKQPGQSNTLERLAAALGLSSGITEPFGRFETPRSLQVGSDFAETAFRLSPEEPLSTEPLVGDEAVYVIALKQRIPSRVPSLEEVQIRVAQDYRLVEARKLALEAARKFEQTLTSGNAQGKDFNAICASSGIQPIRPGPFSQSTQSLPALANRVDLGLLKDVAQDLKPGKTSDLVSTRDGAMVVHVTSRTPVDEARMKEELPRFVEDLREEKQRVAVNEWLRKEMEQAQITGLPTFSRNQNRAQD